MKIESKYDPVQAVKLDPQGKSLKFDLKPFRKSKVSKVPKWAKGLKIDEENGIIISWTSDKTCFNDIDTSKSIYRFTNLTAPEDFITDIIISELFRYFIVAT